MEEASVREDPPVRLDNVSLRCLVAAVLAGNQSGPNAKPEALIARYFEVLQVLKKVSVYPKNVEQELQKLHGPSK